VHLRRWTSLLWTASLLTLTGSQASAQTLFQRRPGGELGLSAVGRSTSTAGRTGLRTLAYRQWLSLPFWGSIVHPRLFQYSLLLAPSFRQEDTKGAESLTIARDLGVNLTAQLLPEMPLSATVAFLRSSGDADGSNSEGSYRQRALTGIVSFQNAYFPMTLRVGEQRWRSEWSDPVVPLPFMQRYVNRSMRLSGSSRRLEVLWEQTSHDDQVGQEDFEGSVLQARHNLEWGKGSRLSTTWGRNQRLGSNPFDRRTWVQGLQLQHTEGISSRFQLQRITTGGPEVSTSSTRFYGYTFQARISPAFSGSFGASLHRTSFGSTQDRGFEFGPRLTFRTNLPAEVVLTAGASTNYESRERTDGGEGDVQAFDEPHKIDETRRAVLDNLDALIETVVVRSADGVTLYADGVDYRLVPVGSQVDIIVLADGRITIGETLLISYRYRVPIELPAKAVQSGLDLMFRRGSVSFTQSVMRRWALGSDGAYGGDALDWMSSLAFTRWRRPPSCWCPIAGR